MLYVLINPGSHQDSKLASTKKWTLFHKWKKAKLLPDWLNYTKHLNLLTHLKKKAEIMYYRNKAKLYGQDKSKTWQLVNEISNYKRKVKTNIKCIIDKDGIEHTDPVSKANCLNDHFGSVGKNMAENYQNTPSSLKDPLSFMQKKIHNSFVLSGTNSFEISTLIRKLNNKKSSGYDSISNKVLKETKDTILPYLVVLFNKSGTFPDPYKIAQVIPLFKGGDKTNPNSYRPISLLPAIGKLFEKLLAKRLINFLVKYDLFSKHQFGFRAKFSTEYAATDLYEKLLHNLDQGLNSCTIFLDLAKAFDSVNHEILIRKLNHYGVRGKALDLFRSYLSGRSQFLKLDNVKSFLINIEFGVPQGSILGPLLFLIFINDLPQATKLYIKLFADDTVLCAQNEDLLALEDEVNNELDKVFSWMASNQLTLNIKKSQFMLVTNKRNVGTLKIKINDIPLVQCDSYKYLGIHFDSKLNWKTHIQHVCNKVSKACGALAKLRHCVPDQILIDFFNALIHSYLRYGILIWGSACTTTLKPLETLVNKAVRIMSFAPLGNINLSQIYNDFNLLRLTNIHSLELGKFAYKEKMGLLPTQIGNYFAISSNYTDHAYETRVSSSNVSQNKIIHRLQSSVNSVQFKSDILWTSLPNNFKSLETVNIFKRNYKKYLILEQ